MTSKPYDALTIAKWFIAWAEANEADRSHLKIQKLLYFAQGHHLAKYGQPLFREQLEAWAHGPVVSSVYHAFKSSGAADVVIEDDAFSWDDVDAETSQFLIAVWDAYGALAPWKLRNITHDQAPWKNHFEDGTRNKVIPQADIERYFASTRSTF